MKTERTKRTTAALLVVLLVGAGLAASFAFGRSNGAAVGLRARLVGRTSVQPARGIFVATLLGRSLRWSLAYRGLSQNQPLSAWLHPRNSARPARLCGSCATLARGSVRVSLTLARAADPPKGARRATRGRGQHSCPRRHDHRPTGTRSQDRLPETGADDYAPGRNQLLDQRSRRQARKPSANRGLHSRPRWRRGQTRQAGALVNKRDGHAARHQRSLPGWPPRSHLQAPERGQRSIPKSRGDGRRPRSDDRGQAGRLRCGGGHCRFRGGARSATGPARSSQLRGSG
jgi:hypothetical protein